MNAPDDRHVLGDNTTDSAELSADVSQWNRWPRPQASVYEALERVFHSGDWGRYRGVECDRLREELGAYFTGREAYLCASGTLGVELALRGLAIQAGDEVVLAGYDFPGNFRAIEAVGAFPVLADLRAGHWTFGLEQLEQAVTANTSAIIVSHLHGDLAPMDDLCRWARSRGLAVVEDACQAPGGQVGGRPVGSWGDVSVLSFGGSKLLTAGRGGAVLSADRQVLQRIRVYAERGNDAFALSELQAAVIRPQLRSIDQDTRQRQLSVVLLRQQLHDVRCLESAPLRSLADEPAYYKLGWWYHGSNVDRGLYIQALQAAGIPIDTGFRGFALRTSRRCRHAGGLANCRFAAERTLVLHHPVLLQDPMTINKLARRISEITTRLKIEVPV